MSNLQYDIELAFSILNKKGECSDKFKLYPWSNEHIEKYYDYYSLIDKNALCITGSGDHALYAAANGASKIDCVDINPLAKYYQALKIALILAYDEKTFFKHFINRKKRLLTHKIKLDDIKEFMDDDMVVFWNEILSSKSFKKNGRLFRDDGFPNKFKLDYEHLKEELKCTKIKYYDSDINDFINENNEKYDAIFLSNVLEWQASTNRTIILNKYLELLTKNGILYDTYIKRDFSYGDPLREYEKKIVTTTGFPGLSCSEKGVYAYRKK